MDHSFRFSVILLREYHLGCLCYLYLYEIWHSTNTVSVGSRGIPQSNVFMCSCFIIDIHLRTIFLHMLT